VGASASGGLLFPSVRLQENDEFDMGEFLIRVVHTPGHTPESISFMVEVQGKPTAIFGGAARVDLLGTKIAPFLARWLHNTIHEKLLKLPDEVEVYPTHGGGSFCSAATAGGGGVPTTIAQERLTNPFAAEAEETQLCPLRPNRAGVLSCLLQIHGRHQQEGSGYPGRRSAPGLLDRAFGAASTGVRCCPD
tara:strand:+ start:349 stop:921 length:573 start_codon:yes stop_codon:yes gene_type:complete